MDRTMSRVLITLPENLLASLDERARQAKKSRSAVMRTALTDWITEQERAEFEELLAAGYVERAARLEEFAAEFAGAQGQALSGTWRWGA